MLLILPAFSYSQAERKFSDSQYIFSLQLESLHNEYNDSSVKSINITNRKTGKLVQHIITQSDDFIKSGKDGFIIEDMNFDGHNDFRLLEIVGKRGNEAFLYWIFDTKSGKFKSDTTLEEISTPYFDHKKKLIQTGWHDASGLVGHATYCWKQNRLYMLYERDDYRDPNSDDVIIEVTQRVNGKLKITYRRKISRDKYDTLDESKIPQHH